MTALTRRKPPRSGIKRSPQREFPGHRAWVRGFNCIVANGECKGKIEAAHYDGPMPVVDRGGIGLKDHDKWCLPMCTLHHGIYHRGWKSFEAKYGVDTRKAAEDLARRSPHRFKWREE